MKGWTREWLEKASTENGAPRTRGAGPRSRRRDAKSPISPSTYRAAWFQRAARRGTSRSLSARAKRTPMCRCNSNSRQRLVSGLEDGPGGRPERPPSVTGRGCFRPRSWTPKGLAARTLRRERAWGAVAGPSCRLRRAEVNRRRRGARLTRCCLYPLRAAT